jgi:CheY-like chemotaxis protein
LTATALASDAGAMASANSLRVLLVEDEMLIRELAAEDLADAGCVVVALGNGDDALALIEQDRDFAVLFTDIRMPGAIDGRELGQRALAMIPGIRVVYATGYNDPQIEVSAQECCVRKPYQVAEVLAQVSALGVA